MKAATVRCPLEITFPKTQIYKYECTYFFYKQPVYKQPDLGLQIAKQLSGLNPIELSNNKIKG